MSSCSVKLVGSCDKMLLKTKNKKEKRKKKGKKKRKRKRRTTNSRKCLVEVI
jgi:hypothetical protein